MEELSAILENSKRAKKLARTEWENDRQRERATDSETARERVSESK